MVPDEELLGHLSELLRSSRRTEADLVAHIGEIDRRRLYARAAAPSMFAYCTQLLHLSEAEAYLRIAAARAAREHPQLLAMLGDGRLHLSGIAKLAPHLRPENCGVLLRRAAHLSKRQIEELVAEISPRPDVPCRLLKLPERSLRGLATPPPPATLASSARPGVAAAGSVSSEGAELRPGTVAAAVASRGSTRPAVEPLAPSRYKVQFTASAELCSKIERLQALMRAELPGADLSAVIDSAVTQALRRLEARRYARTSEGHRAAAGAATAARPHIAAAGRYIPAAVRRAVFERDGGRCRYRDPAGRRCPERHRLEYHHLHPFARGGPHALDNLRLMCRTHNLHLAEHDYGERAMAAYRKPVQPASV
jgi:hypothetical protein